MTISDVYDHTAHFLCHIVLNQGGIARRIPLLKVGYGSQLAATLMAGNMAGNNNLNLKLFLSKERLCTKIKP